MKKKFLLYEKPTDKQPFAKITMKSIYPNTYNTRIDIHSCGNQNPNINVKKSKKIREFVDFIEDLERRKNIPMASQFNREVVVNNKAKCEFAINLAKLPAIEEIIIHGNRNKVILPREVWNVKIDADYIDSDLLYANEPIKLQSITLHSNNVNNLHFPNIELDYVTIIPSIFQHPRNCKVNMENIPEDVRDLNLTRCIPYNFENIPIKFDYMSCNKEGCVQEFVDKYLNTSHTDTNILIDIVNNQDIYPFINLKRDDRHIVNGTIFVRFHAGQPFQMQGLTLNEMKDFILQNRMEGDFLPVPTKFLGKYPLAEQKIREYYEGCENNANTHQDQHCASLHKAIQPRTILDITDTLRKIPLEDNPVDKLVVDINVGTKDIPILENELAHGNMLNENRPFIENLIKIKQQKIKSSDFNILL